MNLEMKELTLTSSKIYMNTSYSTDGIYLVNISDVKEGDEVTCGSAIVHFKDDIVTLIFIRNEYIIKTTTTHETTDITMGDILKVIAVTKDPKLARELV